MKQYYTLIQDFSPLNDKSLCEYLTEQGIKYDMGADFADEFISKNHYLIPEASSKLMSKCVALIEDHELSAIMLSVGGVIVVDNRPFINVKNKVRGCFSWFVD